MAADEGTADSPPIVVVVSVEAAGFVEPGLVLVPSPPRVVVVVSLLVLASDILSARTPARPYEGS